MTFILVVVAYLAWRLVELSATALQATWPVRRIARHR